MVASGEIEDEGAQRERYQELLAELRTIIPGVQVLFAFLLTAPFAGRFAEVDGLGRDIYAASLVGTALAATTFMTPAAYHRLATGSGRATRIRLAIRLTIVGLVLLALSVAAAVFVVGRFVFDSSTVGGAIAAAVGLTTVGLWFALPLSRRR
jgi:hypothetical protein